MRQGLHAVRLLLTLSYLGYVGEGTTTVTTQTTTIETTTTSQAPPPRGGKGGIGASPNARLAAKRQAEIGIGTENCTPEQNCGMCGEHTECWVRLIFEVIAMTLGVLVGAYFVLRPKASSRTVSATSSDGDDDEAGLPKKGRGVEVKSNKQALLQPPPNNNSPIVANMVQPPTAAPMGTLPSNAPRLAPTPTRTPTHTPQPSFHQAQYPQPGGGSMSGSMIRFPSQDAPAGLSPAQTQRPVVPATMPAALGLGSIGRVPSAHAAVPLTPPGPI